MSFWAFQWIIKKYNQVLILLFSKGNIYCFTGDFSQADKEKREEEEEEQPKDDIDMEEEDNIGNKTITFQWYTNVIIDVNEVMSILNNTDLEKLLESV